jgi:hypothetical protein
LFKLKIKCASRCRTISGDENPSEECRNGKWNRKEQDQHLVDDFDTEVYTEVSGVAVGTVGSLRTAAGQSRGTEVPTQRRPQRRGMVPKRVPERSHTGMRPDADIRGMETDREMSTVVTMALGMKAEKAQNRGGLKLNVEELVVEDGLQARGSVKVVRLEVDSTSEMESEDSERSDRLKSEA